jgi:hypothetical protein
MAKDVPLPPHNSVQDPLEYWAASCVAVTPALAIAAPGREVLAAFDKFIADGVPRFGVVITQEVTRQKFPLPLVLPVASDGVTALTVKAETLALAAPA